MTISLEHFSFNEILHFKFSGSVDSSKTASSQTSSVSPVSVSTSTSLNDSRSPSTSAMISTVDTEEQDKLAEEKPPLKFSTPKQDNRTSKLTLKMRFWLFCIKRKN